MIKAAIIIPTYNEAKNLPLLVEEIFAVIDNSKIDLELIIVDDNSPDKTGLVAEELAKDYPIKVIHRSGKLGLGSAVLEGFAKSSRDYVGAMDGDLSHDPAILNKLILSMLKYDIAIGSRFNCESHVEKWNWRRRSISGIGVFLASRLTNTLDPLSGYFFIKKSVIKNIQLTTTGYKILFEILVKGNYSNIIEFPYTFRMRKHSESKLNYKEFWLFFKQLLSYALYKIKL
ncbi:polyprenol monophosphomannose synthase [Patescibacteria group bacterium]|nr:polyprenol monophosphomannose synthase [Candidatus Falkowbacteria bacterium]MBU3906175.1 polyprenol monophosphomannose synthase [Patescibacteria group bacterium]MCG2697495.1 polyprenol monophosphomannose synthase [Candidatus Parcubacteria bacterium]MBU4014995.1 polyprenol monophosphomannose synthase [Patescibacteria group bacterium]MBU4026668.1 polyprenol monophosphomannose synthase [Patescibacteria group bacterium]